MSSRWRLHLVMLCVTIIFGINGPFTKALLGGGLTPYTHMFCRFLGATILFWIASLWVPRERIDRKDWGKMTLASLTGIFFNQGLFAIGMSMTSPVNQSLVATLGPIVTMLLAAVVLKEPITRLKGIGVLIGASGALLLVSTNGSSTAGSTRLDLRHSNRLLRHLPNFLQDTHTKVPPGYLDEVALCHLPLRLCSDGCT